MPRYTLHNHNRTHTHDALIATGGDRTAAGLSFPLPGADQRYRGRARSYSDAALTQGRNNGTFASSDDDGGEIFCHCSKQHAFLVTICCARTPVFGKHIQIHTNTLLNPLPPFKGVQGCRQVSHAKPSRRFRETFTCKACLYSTTSNTFRFLFLLPESEVDATALSAYGSTAERSVLLSFDCDLRMRSFGASNLL